MELKSTIKSVTVYKDRALVERSATSSLTEGEHQLVFTGLPVAIDTNSVQLSGGENAILQDLKIKDVHLENISDEQIKNMQDEIEELEELIQAITDKINNTNQEKAFLLNLASLNSEPSKKTVLSLFAPEKMEQMLTFYGGKLNALDDSIRENNKELKKLNNRLYILQNKISNYNSSNLKTEKQVELKIFVKESTDIELKLSYIVYSATWAPIYDLRLNSNQKKLSVAYNALVRQQTGEKWEDVELKLSTAQPQLSGTTPLLHPWYVDVYTYEPPVMKKELAKSKKKTMMRSAKIAPEGIMDDEFEMSMEEMEEAPMEFKKAVVETGATSVVFAIPGTNTIENNYEEHKIGVSSVELEAELEYNSVPKLSPYAFLTGTSSNTSEYPLLAGKTNIFLDNSFVANSNLKLVAPNEKFTTSLGVDEGIKIEHKLVNKFSKDEGLFSKKNKHIYEYKIEVSNNKSVDALVKIKDQLPLSQHQDIKVELVEPKIKENTEALKKQADGTIEWKLELAPTDKTELKLKFSVEYPRDTEITGL